MKTRKSITYLFRGLALGALMIAATGIYFGTTSSGAGDDSSLRGNQVGIAYPSSESSQGLQAAAYWVQRDEAEEMLFDELRESFIGKPVSSDEIDEATSSTSDNQVKDPILIMEELREADRRDDERFMIQYWNELKRKADRAQMGGTTSRGETQEVVTGSGTITEEITRTTEDLTPCPDDPAKKVQLAQRVGNAAFDGLISNALTDGQVQLRALVDPCAVPTQGPFTIDYSLDDATVDGLTGDLKIQVTALTSGSVFDPGGAKSMGHFTIQGISGELKEAQGQGLIVSHATSTSSFRAYYAEIRPR
jgi:hypothetical protein